MLYDAIVYSVQQQNDVYSLFRFLEASRNVCTLKKFFFYK